MATYTHAYAITFEIDSQTEDASDVTLQQLAAAIRERVGSCVDHGNLLDAVGAPYDTFEKKEV